MKIKINIIGMSCAACSARIEKVVGRLENVAEVSVNLLQNYMTAQVQGEADIQLIIKKIEGLGFKAELETEKNIAENNQKDEGIDKLNAENNNLKKRFIMSLAFLVPLMYFSMGTMFGAPVPFFLQGMNNALSLALVQFVLTIPVLFINRSYFTKGIKALFLGGANMDSLIAIGSGAAMVYGVFVLFKISYALGQGDMETVHHFHMEFYFESAATILTLITMGKFLEAKSKGKTGAAISKLISISPKTALVEIDGVQAEIPASELKIGQTIIILPGSRIPADGTVISGESAVDEAAITGESLPVEKFTGDKLRAATVNTWGRLVMRADKVGKNTMFAEIIALVEEAGAKKAPIAKLADKISGVFVPIVIGIAVITFAIWLLLGFGFELALSMGISVLVISCPCALGLATPVAVMAGTGKGAENGILIKSGEAFEIAHKVNTVVFDKTGTITVGKHVVKEISEYSKDLKTIAYSLESCSEHPLATAVNEHFIGEKKQAVENFKSEPGLGVTGVINGERYFGGSARYIKEKTNLDLPEIMEGGTQLVFASSSIILGVICTSDTIKADAVNAILQLKKMKIKTIMLTGDRKSAAQEIGQLAGVDEIISDVLPSDKEKKVRGLMESGSVVAMVGDGINDSPALAAANVGFAMGSGTDVALESAGIIITGDKLMSVPRGIQLSKRVMRTIRQNLFWAFFYNTVGIPVAAGLFYLSLGLKLSPVIAALAMSFSSVCVVLNALRISWKSLN